MPPFITAKLSLVSVKSRPISHNRQCVWNFCTSSRQSTPFAAQVAQPQRGRTVWRIYPPEDKEEDPVEKFHFHRRKNSVTKSIALSCMSNALINPTERRLGQAVLNWLWDRHDQIKSPDDARLVNRMTRLLVREDREEIIWKWMCRPCKQPGHRPDWRLLALDSLMVAHANKYDRKALDRALKYFFRAVKEPWSIPLHSAARTLSTRLSMPVSVVDTPVPHLEQGTFQFELQPETWRPRYPQTNVKLWEKFWSHLEALTLDSPKATKELTEQIQAQMMLYHPVSPNPELLLRFLRKVAGDPQHSLHMIYKYPKAETTAYYLWTSIKRAEYLLRENGQNGDADWMIKTFTEILEKLEEKLKTKRGVQGPRDVGSEDTSLVDAM